MKLPEEVFFKGISIASTSEFQDYSNQEVDFSSKKKKKDKLGKDQTIKC